MGLRNAGLWGYRCWVIVGRDAGLWGLEMLDYGA